MEIVPALSGSRARPVAASTTASTRFAITIRESNAYLDKLMKLNKMLAQEGKPGVDARSLTIIHARAVKLGYY